MRRLIWLGIVFVLGWSGWWFFASSSLQNGIDLWLSDRRAEGWQAEVVETRTGGYPFALEATLVSPVLTDPDSGVAFTASQLEITAPAWWPGYVSVAFPQDDMGFASPLVRHTVQADTAIADFRLHPGTALEVEELALRSGAWVLAAPEGSLMGADGLTLSMLQAPDDPNQYAFLLDAPAFEPGRLPRSALRVPDDWPVAFDSLAVALDITFDRRFDRTTLEDARPQPRRVNMERAEAKWGALSLLAAATLDVAPDGQLSGEVSLQARNWQDILILAETAGALPSGLRPQLESVLGALARSSGNPDNIDATLTLRDGRIFIGFIPLGRAPRLILR